MCVYLSEYGALCLHSAQLPYSYEPNETMYRENPNYVLSWFVHGLLEADVAIKTPFSANSSSTRSKDSPIEVARGMIDWFSQQQTNTLLPEFMPPDRTTSDVPPVSACDIVEN